jgi:predicted component of type VI protein secretion system
MGAAVKTDIHISHPDGAARTLAFTQPLIRIGRVEALQGARNDIVLTGDGVSKEHAQLVVSDDGITVVDRSRNGTFVNGALVRQPHRLQPGEAVEIDRYVLRCSAAPAPAPARPGLEIELVPPADLEFVPPDDELPRFDGSEQPFAPPHDDPHDDLHDDLLGDLPLDDPDDLPPANPVRRDDHPTPAQAPHPRDEPPREPLAAAYHALAAEFGAAAWGDPPRSAGWSSALAAARRITAQHPSLAGDPVWPERLAREVCGLGPLDRPPRRHHRHRDQRAAAPRPHRGPPRRGPESARRPASRASRLLAAAFARWTGERLGERRAPT